MNIKVHDAAWVLIYICFFGISELIIKYFVGSDHNKMIYFTLCGIIGAYLLYNS